MKSGSKAAAAEEEKTIIGSPLGELLIEPPLRFDENARPRVSPNFSQVDDMGGGVGVG